MVNGRIVMADGTEIRGESAGSSGTAVGSLMPYTSMTDYQSILCDPACRDQLICLTYPLIGNVGTVDLAGDSEKIEAGGIIIRETISQVDHWLSQKNLSAWFREQGKVALSGIDTRQIIRILRQTGPQNAVITTDMASSRQELAQKAADWQPEPPAAEKNNQQFCAIGEKKYHLAILDLGLRPEMITALTGRGCDLTVFTVPLAAQVLGDIRPDALVLSGGSEQAAMQMDAPILKLVHDYCSRLPVLAVDAGYLLLARSYGLQPQKMKLGHSGANYPVQDMQDCRTRMTLQHHSYVIDREQVANRNGCIITHQNINDGTVEGISYGPGTASVQFIPDADNMPHQTGYIWDNFLREIG